MLTDEQILDIAENTGTDIKLGVFNLANMRAFAKACYQQGREDMHRDVMTEFHRPYDFGKKQWIKRIEELK